MFCLRAVARFMRFFVVYEGLCIVWNRFCMKGYMFRVSKDRRASHKSDDVRFWVH